ncbi:hypothetical protein CMV_022661 [Castanea mollissima]|uniref:Uncharacterized protein n=1 Tax=Castanea mollissima TaxID=60419 RepID=A0A8J4V7T0_9ROSI|nr:hypothetical protein CMV_022661 [Castanea mollissima]
MLSNYQKHQRATRLSFSKILRMGGNGGGKGGGSGGGGGGKGGGSGTGGGAAKSGGGGSSGGGSGGKMVAPGSGGGSRISRDSFQSNPQIYFAGLHAGQKGKK